MITLRRLSAILSLFALAAPLAQAEIAHAKLKTSFQVYTTEGSVLPAANTNKLVTGAIRKNHSLLDVTHSMLNILEAAGGLNDYQFTSAGFLTSVTVRSKDQSLKAYAASDPQSPTDVTTDQTQITERYYGWCYAINGHMISDTPASEMKVSRHDQVIWYFGHLDQVNGVFQKDCVAEYAPLAAQLK